MLNSSKPYFKTALFLKENNVKEKELIKDKDPVYKKIVDLFGRDHVFYHCWTSFSNKYAKPTAIRMRDDNFLKKAVEKKLDETFVFFSCIRINNKKVYFVLTSNYFTNYCHSTKSGNSFLRFDLNDLYDWSKNSNKLFWKKRHIKHKGSQPIYCFWVGTDSEKNYKLLFNYLNILSIIETTNYSILNTKQNKKSRISIPNSVIKQADYNYKNLCTLINNHTCYWSNENINVSLKLTKEHHHIVPEEWFFQNHIIESSIVNDPNNIVLLCDKCHDKIHSTNNEIREEALNNLLDSMKVIGTYDNFINYLENKVFITLPILYKIYNLKYEQ